LGLSSISDGPLSGSHIVDVGVVTLTVDPDLTLKADCDKSKISGVSLDVSGKTEDSHQIGFKGAGGSAIFSISFGTPTEVSSNTNSSGTTTAKYEVTPTTTLVRTIDYILGSSGKTETKTQSVIKFTLTCDCK
jgi:hypothetical protein